MANYCLASKKKVLLLICIILAKSILYSQTVDFNVNKISQCQGGNYFTFTCNATAGATSYLWSFGDGTTSTDLNPVKVYQYSGNYSVQLMATYNAVNYYINKTIEVNPEPVCSFNYYAATNTGNSYSFQSTSSINSGYINYTWDFGDSSIDFGTNPVHTFGYNGYQTVTMKALSNKGCSCSTSQTIDVTVSVANVINSMGYSINNTTQCLNNNSFFFNNYSNSISGATYSWDFGDGTTSTNFSPTHVYNSSGNFIVSLIAHVSGNDILKKQTVTVLPKPQVTISSNGSNICPGNTVNFNANTTNTAGYISYQWIVNNQHVGSNSASYSNSALQNGDIVRCIMSTNNTCWNSVTDTSNPITISIVSTSIPTVSISSNIYNVCFGNAVKINSIVSDNTAVLDYNFKVNGVSIQTGTSTNFSSNILTDSQRITLAVTVGNACMPSTVINSNTIVFRFNNGAGNVWTGNIDANITNTGNWCYGTIPSNIDIQSIGNNRYPVLQSDLTVHDLNLSAGTFINLGSHTLTITGSVNGNGTIKGSLNANLIINSTQNNLLNFDTTATNNSINNLTVSNSNVTLLSNLKIYGVLSIPSGTFDANNKLLTFVSNTLGTASLDKVNDGIHGTFINGNNVVIQRYHINKRAWMFLTAPLTTYGTNYTGDIKSNWQKGTYITGPSNNTAGGLDAGTNNNYSMFTWLGNSGWTPITNTIANNTLMGNAGGSTADNKAFYFFLRGDRTVSPSQGIGASSDVTLEAKGAIQTGTKYFALPSVGTFAFVANPYPAPIDLDKFLSDNANLATAGIGASTIYYWDPNCSGTGGYTTAFHSPASGWVFSSKNNLNNRPRTIQSGQAFFVFKNGASTVVFNESQKNTDSSNNNLFGSNQVQTIKVNLSKGNTYIDGIAGLYDNTYSKAVIAPGEDASKFWGNEEGVGIVSNAKYLSIEARPAVSTTDTMYLYLNKMTVGSTYNFDVSGINIPANLNGYLVDKYLHKSIALNFNDSSKISFLIDTNAGSKSASRFMIVLNNNTSLPVDNLTISAEKLDNTALVKWSNTTENQIDHYSVESSNNGKEFKSIYSTTIQHNATGNYSFVDQSINNATVQYYRIKAVEKDGSFHYSKVVSIITHKNSYSIYPNPATTEINVHSATEKSTLIISDMSGRIVLNKALFNNNNSINVSSLKPGTYTAAIQTEEGVTTTKLVIEK